MTEEEIRRYTWEVAIEAMVTRTYNLALGLYPDASEQVIAANETAWVSEMEKITLGKLGPALSDRVAAEFQTALSGLLATARQSRAKRRE